MKGVKADMFSVAKELELRESSKVYWLARLVDLDHRHRELDSERLVTPPPQVTMPEMKAPPAMLGKFGTHLRARHRLPRRQRFQTKR